MSPVRILASLSVLALATALTGAGVASAAPEERATPRTVVGWHAASWYYLAGVDVIGAACRRDGVVLFGDSLRGHEPGLDRPADSRFRTRGRLPGHSSTTD